MVFWVFFAQKFSGNTAAHSAASLRHMVYAYRAMPSKHFS